MSATQQPDYTRYEAWWTVYPPGHQRAGQTVEVVTVQHYTYAVVQAQANEMRRNEDAHYVEVDRLRDVLAVERGISAGLDARLDAVEAQLALATKTLRDIRGGEHASIWCRSLAGKVLAALGDKM